MKLDLLRYYSTDWDTLSLLFIDGFFFCHALEDAYHEEKIAGKTRIPRGRYGLRLRWFPTLSPRYGHEMIELVGVPDYEGVAFHVGNDDEDTKGCILLGYWAQVNPGQKSFLGNSSKAYKAFYEKVQPALKNDETVTCEIKNLTMVPVFHPFG